VAEVLRWVLAYAYVCIMYHVLKQRSVCVLRCAVCVAESITTMSLVVVASFYIYIYMYTL
jgi:hypothetical protein